MYIKLVALLAKVFYQQTISLILNYFSLGYNKNLTFPSDRSLSRSRAMRTFSCLRTVIKRTGLVLTVFFLLAATVNAYTVVMRGGRRIEVPANFVVTPYTLTYEVSEGVQVTLQISAIDIPATEIANNESPGALLSRVRSEQTGHALRGVTAATRRTITNRDLEATSRRRRESESAYAKRIKEMGLPSLEESRSRAAAESEVTRRELAQVRENQQQSESYWRARAQDLRTEIAALDAEIRFIRVKLEEMPSPNWGGSFTTVTSIAPFISFGNFGGRRQFPGGGVHRPSVYVAPRGGPLLGGRFGMGRGSTRAQISINTGRFGHRGGSFGSSSVFGNAVLYGSALPNYDFSYERSALVTQFNEMAAARAGLSARWRELEEEARRAGAPPGWLRE